MYQRRKNDHVPVMVGSQDPRTPYIWDPIGSGESQRSEGSDLGFGFFRIRIQDPDHTANTSDLGSTDPDLNKSSRIRILGSGSYIFS